MWDIIVVGSGIIGSSIARELSFLNASILVIEKEEDVASGTTKANSGIIHSGYDAKNGSLKAKFNIEAISMLDEVINDLEVPFLKCGTLTLISDEKDLNQLLELQKQGIRNGVKNLSILNKKELDKIEPNLQDCVTHGLFASEAGIISPFEFNLALAQNAYDNGTQFNFNEELINIVKKDRYYEVITTKNSYKTKIIVNAAGVYGDKINNLVNPNKIEIIPRKGEYLVLGHPLKALVNRPIFKLPTKLGKGVLVTNTCENNILIGPSAHDILDKEDTMTTSETLKYLKDNSNELIDLSIQGKIISTFSGLRAISSNDDFIVEKSMDGFYNAVGICSPGLSAALAIAKHISTLIESDYSFVRKENIIKKRNKIKLFKEYNIDDQNALIASNPNYGKVVCYCEKITLQDLINVTTSRLGAKSLDGIKRRTFAQAGGCQGGFCGSACAAILADVLNIDLSQITKNNQKSTFVEGVKSCEK